MPFCQECGSSLVTGSRSCGDCGHVFGGAASPPAREATVDGAIRHSAAGVGARVAAGAVDLLPLIALGFLDSLLQRRGLMFGRVIGKVLLLLPVVLLLLRDSLAGLSPGKWLLGIRARDRQSGEPAGMPDSILRNFPLLAVVLAPLTGRFAVHIMFVVLAVHVLLILVNRRGLTDLIGGTEVTLR